MTIMIGTRIKMGVAKWGALLLLLTASHALMYWKGRVHGERAQMETAIEELANDVHANAQRVESQVTRISNQATRITRQAERTQEAISENREANLDPNCRTSDDELRELNAAVATANRGLPASGDADVPRSSAAKE